MQVQFVGCGDAFGSGGRFNTCIHIVGERANFLIDCGTSSLIAMQRLSIARNSIDAIFITHFHADHFGGIPFFILDAQFISKRVRPLTIVGPQGLKAWYPRIMETAFAGSSAKGPRFELSLQEVEPGSSAQCGEVHLTSFHVVHDDRAGPCLGYRFEVEDRIIAFSGDTEWTGALVQLGRDADLFICECYVGDRAVPMHMSLVALQSHLAEIRPKRMMLTHMSQDMLAHPSLPYETAADGKVVML